MTQEAQTLDANIIIQREYRARIAAGQPLPAFHVSPDASDLPIYAEVKP